MTAFYFYCSSLSSLVTVAYICIDMLLWQRQSFLPILLIRFLVCPKPKGGLSPSDILLSTKLLLFLFPFYFVSFVFLWCYYLPTVSFIFFYCFSDGSTQNMQFPFWYKSYYFFGLILLLTISRIFTCKLDWGTYPKVLLLLFFLPFIISNIIFLQEWRTLINKNFSISKLKSAGTSTSIQRQYPIAL